MDRIWLAQYQEGVPHTINPEEHASLVSLFEDSCKAHAKKTAYVNLGCELTYEELDKKSYQFALYLQQLGLKRGTRVALMMPNVLQYPIALFGLLRGGFIAVNTNPLYTSDELIHQMNDSGTEVIVVLANFAKTVEKALPHTGIKHVVVTEIGDVFPTVKRILVNAVVKYIKKLVPPYHLPMAIRFNETLKQDSSKTLKPVSLNHQDIAFLQYTGGTTGVAKGAVLTHGNMVCNVLQAYAWIKPLHIEEQDIIVTALPLYHIFSLTANCLTFLKAGAKNILITNPRDIPHFIDEIKNSRFTAITGVNTLFNALLNNPKFKDIDFSRVKLALSGGMALQKSVSLRWKEMTKTRVLEAYGLTETSPAVTINPMYLEDYNGSIGLPLPSTDITIRDESGQEVSLGTPGELCVKGPQVMAGYWQRPDETALVFTKDGFLRTGDIATVDDKGFVYLVDRKKDMIVVSGFNVYPNEVEQVISMHPGVLEVGVVGEPHEETGERVKACIVKRDPKLTAEEIIALCKEHLTAYKIPKVVEFYHELPKTNVGKILRRALRG
ncbi:long-chain-fatty-acid--CoA ligase [Legionella taurinensis]|uniref:Long-chain-fatty-acid--CoA ligase n=1 Tax=Legionella taurinensis TaxID=70611 RepID=A0A3A5LFR2_9GAMM|nr:AMP-binding protein [Legionella taurinensis]MDX1836899.1 AMP-binding protein [Legionella taurinensis]PUT41312.1 long-chain-fatty-acid--CoA ligase [Legionella taurinensis]PUT42437.1 long-chain-fatty-acid--CoA ligase [Legionella taurinensis]PUT46578.1 long-chain-fatty-acid--CoA ligase [Legionella taurinensis]PUT47218.1 long-chain-fatty-acid--CoA ligase [Legionella taurinensis]